MEHEKKMFFDRRKWVVFPSPCTPTTHKKTQVDSTGAGDAFFGGMIASMYHNGLPTNESQLYSMATLAITTGAASVESLGALPHFPQSARRLTELLPSAKDLCDKHPIPVWLREEEEEESTTFKPEDPNPAFVSSIHLDASLLSGMAENMDWEAMTQLTELLVEEGAHNNECRIFTTGIGKSAIVARRMAASLSSLSVGVEFCFVGCCVVFFMCAVFAKVVRIFARFGVFFSRFVLCVFSGEPPCLLVRCHPSPKEIMTFPKRHLGTTFFWLVDTQVVCHVHSMQKMPRLSLLFEKPVFLACCCLILLGISFA